MTEKRGLRAAAVVGLVWAPALSGGGLVMVFGSMAMVIWGLRELSFRPLELLPILLLPLPLW